MISKELDHYLIAEAWTSTEAYANLERLCDLGSRFAGSPSGRAARDFLLAKFEEYGLVEPHAESFEFLVWTRGDCALTARGGGESRALRLAISLVYSPNADRLHGELLDCGIGCEQDFARAVDRLYRGPAHGIPLPGKVAIVNTANPENGRPLQRRQKYGRAVDAG